MSPDHLAARADVQATTGRVGEADRYNPGLAGSAALPDAAWTPSASTDDRETRPDAPAHRRADHHPGARRQEIDEYVGRVNSGTAAVSVARMAAPGGWTEPAQAPEFDEVTLVLRGTVRVEHDGGVLDVRAGEAVLTRAGERVRYSTPDPDGADYVAVCVPAFSPEAAGREE